MHWRSSRPSFTSLRPVGVMDVAQAQLELAIRHLKQVEERIAAQRTKITNMRMAGIPVNGEKEKLEALLQSLEALKTHLANVIDPVNPQAEPGENAHNRSDG